MSLNIVLVEPEIPQNTGNIARTCAAIGATLHLVKPLGFSIDEKHVKRAGLDYWHLLTIKTYENIGEFLDVNKGKKMYFATTKADKTYCDIELFRKETERFADSADKKLKDTPSNLFPERRNLPSASVTPLFLSARTITNIESTNGISS